MPAHKTTPEAPVAPPAARAPSLNGVTPKLSISLHLAPLEDLAQAADEIGGLPGSAAPATRRDGDSTRCCHVAPLQIDENSHQAQQDTAIFACHDGCRCGALAHEE